MNTIDDFYLDMFCRFLSSYSNLFPANEKVSADEFFENESVKNDKEYEFFKDLFYFQYITRDSNNIFKFE